MSQFSNVFLFYSTVILTNIIEIESATIEQSSEVTGNEATTKFLKLLSSIANVNEQRLSALKQYSALEYNGATGILRDGPKKQSVYYIFLLKDVYDSFEKQFNKNNNKQISKNALVNIINTINEDWESPISRTKKDNENDEEETSDGEEIIHEKEMSSPDKVQSENEAKTRHEEEIEVDKDKLKLNINTTMDKKEVLRIWKSCSKKATNLCKKACKAAVKDVCRSYRCSGDMKRSFKRKCKSECKRKFSDND